jgi:hypothetical protein
VKSKTSLPGFAADLPINAIIPARMRAMSGTDVLLCISRCQAQWSYCMGPLIDIGLSNSWQKAYCDQQAANCTASCRNDNSGWGGGSIA